MEEVKKNIDGQANKQQVHGIKKQDENDKDPIILQIKETLEKVAVFIQKDGGDIVFYAFDPKSGTVYVNLLGACQGCMYVDQTITMGVEAILQEEVKGVNYVAVVDDQGMPVASEGEESSFGI